MDPMQAKQIKDEATASTSVNGRPPFNAVKEDLINAIEVVIAQHASLKEAKSAKDEDLQKSLQDDIKEKNQELSDAIDRWVMTRRCEPEEEVRSYKEQEAVDLLCKAIDAERERVNKGGEREKWYDGKDETKMGPLQKAMKNSALVYALPEPFKQYAVPQWKPQSYTRMNPKLEVDADGIEKELDDTPESSGTSKQKLSIDSLVEGQMGAEKTETEEDEMKKDENED